MPTLGERIKALRIKQGFTQEQLAEALHTTKATISRYEKNQRQPRREQITEIACVLGANPDDLFNLLFTSPDPRTEEYENNWAEYLKFLYGYVHEEYPKISKNNEEIDFDIWLTDFGSPFSVYEDNSERLGIIKSLIKILSGLDLKWQRALLNDAQTYIDLQTKKSEKTRMLEQQEE